MGGGIATLWSRFLGRLTEETSGLVTDAEMTEAIQEVNYLDNEEKSFAFELGAVGTDGNKSATLLSTDIAYGRAIRFTIKLNYRVAGHRPNVSIILPAGGMYFTADETGGNVRFLSGNSVLASHKLGDLYGDYYNTSWTYQCYIARVA